MRDQIRRLEALSSDLDPKASEREALRRAVVDLSERYVEGLDPGHAFVETPGRGIGLLDVPFSDRGRPVEEVIGLLEDEVVRPGGHPAAPGHLAFLTGGGIYHAALADFLAAVTNKYAGIFFTGQGTVRMENLVTRWVADVVGYPSSAAGSIASGGSMANLTAIATARDAHSVSGGRIEASVVYLTEQTHHCIEKALHLTGLGNVHVRRIPLDDQYRMRADALADAVASDRHRGLSPWLIVATAGTTDTGAVDPLDDVADVAQRERCWLHVDAAYGGFFMLTEDGRRRLRGIERSDSVVLDPHKSLFLPWGAGIVLARDAGHLISTHQYSGRYLQDAIPDKNELSPADVSPELTRPFRALRIWLPLQLLGIEPFRAALDEKLLLARYFRREIAKQGFEVGPLPDLSTVTFRWTLSDGSADQADKINREIADALRRDGRIFLSTTELHGRTTLRMAALAFRTHLEHVELALELLKTETERVLG